MLEVSVICSLLVLWAAKRKLSSLFCTWQRALLSSTATSFGSYSEESSLCWESWSRIAMHWTKEWKTGHNLVIKNSHITRSFHFKRETGIITNLNKGHAYAILLITVENNRRHNQNHSSWGIKYFFLISQRITGFLGNHGSRLLMKSEFMRKNKPFHIYMRKFTTHRPFKISLYRPHRSFTAHKMPKGICW